MAEYFSEFTGKEIDERLERAGSVSNPNLLDNWYFGNPVNQRGQTSYTGAGYGIDRWKIEAQYNGDAITIKDNGLEVVCGEVAAFHRFLQIIDHPERFRGKTLTWTVKIVSVSDEGNVCGALGYFVNGVEPKYIQFSSTGVYSFSFTVPDDTTELFVHFGAYRNHSLVCDAVKLELGTVQTLAHQENGVWVLNEIPDYGEQLARCQRYQLVMNASGWRKIGNFMNYTVNGTISLDIDTPVQLRANPIVRLTGNEFAAVQCLPTNNYIGNFSLDGSPIDGTLRPGGCSCQVPVTGAIANSAGFFQCNNGTVILDANL